MRTFRALALLAILGCTTPPPWTPRSSEAVPDYPTLLNGHCEQDSGFLVDVADDGKGWSVVWIDCGERVQEMTIGTQVRIVEAVMASRIDAINRRSEK